MMRRGSDDDSSPQPNRLPCSSSPTDECPVFANLSPLKPEKAEPYRFSGTNYPSPRQLFTSPNLEQTVFRDANSNGHEHSDNVVQNPTSGKEIKSCSPSQECSASAIAEPNRQQDDGDAGTRALVCVSSPKQVKPLCSHNLDETTGINKRADELSDLSNIESTKCPRPEQPIAEGDRGSIMLNGTEYDVGNFQGMCPSSNSYINCRPHSNISSRSVDGTDTNKTECGIRRRLDFETENGSTGSGRCNIYTSTYNLANVRLPASTSPIDCDAQEKEILSSVHAIRVGELNPKRKRKRVSVSETEGCKQCNCKRSKCLKLYCECFASGIYCLDSCACANCYNKPEYEDTVHDARQQIESRNPHAFAPKVVPRNTITSSNIIEQDIKWTSARHKRGCNCKKSKCLKKYCECYQSKVGCSDGCRCDNCHNSFGTKTETGYGRVGRWKNESHNAGQAYTDSIKAMGGAQLSSSTWQQQVDITRNFAPSAPPCSEVALYSASSTLWNYAQASQTQFGIGPRFLPHGSFNWPYPINICTQQLQTSEVLSHDYSQHEDITEDDNIPQIIKAVKSSSPN